MRFDNFREFLEGEQIIVTPKVVEPPVRQAPEGMNVYERGAVISFAQRQKMNRAAARENKADQAEQVRRTAEIVAFQADFTRLAEAAADPLIEIREQIAQIEKISQSQQDMDLLGTTPEELASITEHLKELEKEATDTSETMKEVLAQSISDAAQQFTGTFVEGIMSGQNALAGFGDFAKDIVKQIITTFLQMAIVNEILNKVFGGFGGFTALPTLFKKAAGGGTAQRGQPMLVGERGAEIFVPNSSGRIMNNADSMSATGSGGVVINQSINFSTGVVATVRAEVGKMMPQIADTTKAAVLEASQRGGSFRKGLMGAT